MFTLDNIMMAVMVLMVGFIVFVYIYSFSTLGKKLIDGKNGVRYTKNGTAMLLLLAMAAVGYSYFSNTGQYQWTYANAVTVACICIMFVLIGISYLVRKGFYEKAIITSSFPPIRYHLIRHFEIVRASDKTSRIYLTTQATTNIKKDVYVEFDTELVPEVKRFVKAQMKAKPSKAGNDSKDSKDSRLSKDSKDSKASRASNRPAK